MDAESREERVTEIMKEIVRLLSKEGSKSLSSISNHYRASGEMGPCLIAFSRLEAEGLIEQNSDGEWRISQEE